MKKVRLVACLIVPLLGSAQQPPPTQPGTVIRVTAGTSLQPLVERSPAGTRFVLEAGTYRMQSVEPKDGQVFEGEPGAVLNGARLVTGFVPEGGFWWAPTLAPAAATLAHGVCLPDRAQCNRVDDVFFNGVPLRPAATLSATDAAAYFHDQARGRLYLARDPAGALVEAAEAPFAFGGRAARVTIRGLTIEKYGNRAQNGAILGHEGRGWLIENNTVRYNHGVGIAGGPECVVRFNQVLDNGQLGVSADGEGGLIEGNEIARNNTRGYAPEWEAGGGKFAETTGLTLRGNYVHDNAGFGLWTDIDSRATLYQDNVVTGNTWGGIVVDSSQGGALRGNFAARNGKAKPSWLWGAQIMLIASENIEVRNNVAMVDAAGGNGITLIDQERGTGRFGPRRLAAVTVGDNLIVYLGGAGVSGMAGDGSRAMPQSTILFDRNTYIAPGANPRWSWGSLRAWEEFRSMGQETNGRFLPPFPELAQ